MAFALQMCPDCDVGADEPHCWCCGQEMPPKARSLNMAYHAAWHCKPGRHIVHTLVGVMYAQPAPGRPGPFLDVPEPAANL